MSISYECHITIKLDRPKSEIENLVKSIGWKFSAIDGDPVLGREIFCYATKHYPLVHTDSHVIFQVNQAKDLLEYLKLKVVRQKVELIIYDTKVKPNEASSMFPSSNS